MKKILLATAMVFAATTAQATEPEITYPVGEMKHIGTTVEITAIKNAKHFNKDFVRLWVYDRYVIRTNSVYLSESDVDQMITYLQQAKELLKKEYKPMATNKSVTKNVKKEVKESTFVTPDIKDDIGLEEKLCNEYYKGKLPKDALISDCSKYGVAVNLFNLLPSRIGFK